MNIETMDEMRMPIATESSGEAAVEGDNISILLPTKGLGTSNFCQCRNDYHRRCVGDEGCASKSILSTEEMVQARYPLPL